MTKLSGWLQASLAVACTATVSILSEVTRPYPARSAEEIRVTTPSPLTLTLSVEDLETFANTGELTGGLKLYGRFLDESLLAQLQQGLTFKIPFDVVVVDNLAYSPLGRDVLFNLGKMFQVHPGINGQTGLRAALIGAAANAGPEGWTIIDALKAFPTPSLDVELQDLLALQRELAVYFSYNEAAIAAIQAQAADEANHTDEASVAGLPDLSQPGPSSLQTQTITVTNPAIRQTVDGLSVNYDFDVDFYIPDGLTEPAPVVIISHGFGDVKESFTFLAEHLASYGFVVAIPDHVGSDLAYRQEYLNGRLNTLLSPVEFVNRPQEISFLIDTLESLVDESPEWAAIADVTRIGVAGDSLGTTTALALAGAEINYEGLVNKCDQENFIFNFALYLQCRAQYLPPQNYNLRDPRVKAIVAGHPVGGGLYGPEGFSQIDVPLLMISGSKDIVSTVVTEQFHPFVWLQTEQKYLALLDEGTHFSSKPGRDAAEGIFKLLAGDHRDVGTRYYKNLSVAFWNAHLRGQTDYLPYLTARYGKVASEGQPMTLDLISELTATQLETAYGRTPPIPVVPTAIAAPVTPRPESILSEIEQSRVLRIGMRKDAAPFGFINQEDAWDGYCGELALGLRDHLEDELDLNASIEVVELTSTLSDRYDLVRDGTVHLECGPNTIQPDVPGVTFSNPFYVSSAQFLTQADQTERVNPNQSLAGLRLGVLRDTTTEEFVQTTYPNAEPVLFSGPTGRHDAIDAVEQGTIDAFVGDGILSYAEILLAGKASSEFALQPELPLTCEFYGLALPNDDQEWRRAVNQFLASDRELAVTTNWFTDRYPSSFARAEFCLNR